MAHNDYIRPLGFWAVGTLLPAELAAFDLRQFQSINGDLGGSWAPLAQVVIGGAGLHVTGAAVLDSVESMTVVGVSTFSDDVVVNSGALVNLTAGADMQLDSGSLLDIGNGAQLRVLNGGAALLQSGGSLATQSGSIVAIGSGTTVSVSADVALSGQLKKTGAGGRIIGVTRNAAITNVDLLAGVEYDYIRMSNGTGSLQQLTLKIATAPVPTIGEWLIIQKSGLGAGGLTVKNEGSAANLISWAGAAAGSALVYFNGNGWRLAAHYNGTPGADAAVATE